MDGGAEVWLPSVLRTIDPDRTIASEEIAVGLGRESPAADKVSSVNPGHPVNVADRPAGRPLAALLMQLASDGEIEERLMPPSMSFAKITAAACFR